MGLNLVSFVSLVVIRSSNHHRPRTRSDDGQTLRAEWTRAGIVGRQGNVEECMERHIEPRRAPAAIDNRRGADDLRSRPGRDLQGLPRGAARREHVFDDEHAIALAEREAATQGEDALLPLGENGAHAERTADFLADDDAAERWRESHRRPQVARALADGAPERFRVPRILQHERALQIPRTVQPGRESEMPLQQRAGTAEQIKELGGRNHKEQGKRKKGKRLKLKAKGEQIVPYR